MEEVCVTTNGPGPSKRSRTRVLRSGEKRLNSLEANVSEIKQGLTGLTDTLSKLTDTMGKVMAAQAQAAKTASQPRTMPIYQTPEQIIAKTGNLGKNVASQLTGSDQMAEGRVTKDLSNPASQLLALPTNSIVTIAPDSDKYPRYLLDENGNPAPTGKGVMPAKGVIRSYMYTKRNGQRKYKVKFPAFGEEGLTENELVLCST